MKRGKFLRIGILLSILVLELVLHWGSNSPYTYVVTDYLNKKTHVLDGVPVNWDVPHIENLSYFLAQKRFDLGGVTSVDRPLYSFWGNVLQPIFKGMLYPYIAINLIFAGLAVFAIYELARCYFKDEWSPFACGLLFVSSIGVVCYIGQPMFYVPTFCFIPLALFLEKRLGIFQGANGNREIFFFLFLGTGFLIYDLQGLLLYYFLRALFKRSTLRSFGLLGVALIPNLIWNPVLIRWIFSIEYRDAYNQQFRLATARYWLDLLGSFMGFYEGVLKAVIGYMRDLVCAFVLPLFIYALLGVVFGAQRRLVRDMVLLFFCLSLPNFLVGPAVWEFNPRRAFIAFWPVIVLAVEGINSIFNEALAKADGRRGICGLFNVMKWVAIGLVPLFSNLDLISADWRQVIFLYHGDPWR